MSPATTQSQLGVHLELSKSRSCNRAREPHAPRRFVPVKEPSESLNVLRHIRRALTYGPECILNLLA